MNRRSSHVRAEPHSDARPAPYFEGGGITVDLVVADPPYGETNLPWDRWPHGWLQVAAGVSRSMWCFGSMRTFLAHIAEFQIISQRLSQGAR